ncbi:MAG: hypothetical protein NT061_08140 [Spirochaetes bacterium]|nr:hypothetical protein [Spirochaetota bacterium]
MKKIIAVLVLIGLVVSGTFAADSGKTNMDKGDVAASIGLNFGGGFGVGGGFEYMFARWDIANVVPLTFGGAVKAGLDFTPFELTVAGLVTAHFGLATFDVPDWAKKFDWYTGLGLGLGIGSHNGLGFASAGGISYHFTPQIAALFDEVYNIGPYSHGLTTLGVQFKF